jgi:hypothetical protein
MSNFEQYTTEGSLRQISYNSTTNRLFFTDLNANNIKYVTPPSTSVTTITDVSGCISITTNPSGSKVYTTSFNSPTNMSVTDISSGLTTVLTSTGFPGSTNHLVYDNSINCVWSQFSGSIYKITFDNITTPTTATNTLWWTSPNTSSYSLTRDYDNSVMYTVNTSGNVIYRFNPSDVSGNPQTIPFTGLTYTSLQPVLYYSNKRLFFAYKNTNIDNNIKVTYFDVSGSTYTLSTETIIATPAQSSIFYSMIVDNNYYVYFVNNGGFQLYRSQLALCFNQGTKILCRNNQIEEEYVNIELLQIGDLVKTYEHGYKKISKVISGKFQNNPKKWNMCMYKMEKTPLNGLLEDLIVTGGHSILVDTISEEEHKKYDEMGLTDFSKLTIANKRLLLACVSDQFTPMQDQEMYTYYHLLLETNDEEERFGIWANGILTETPKAKGKNNF